MLNSILRKVCQSMTDLGSPVASKTLTNPGNFFFRPNASFSYVDWSACHR